MSKGGRQGIDLTGYRFGKLVAVEPTEKRCRGYMVWKCLCDCGNIKEISAQYFLRPESTRIRSCGCIRQSKILSDKMRTINRLFQRYKNGAKNRNLEFQLSKEEFTSLIFGVCYYCGISPSTQFIEKDRRLPGVKYSGIDRLDSSKGYIKGNVVSCCGICNYMKQDSSKEEFINQAIQIALHCKVYHNAV